MSKSFEIGDILLFIIGFAVVALLISFLVSMIMYTEYERHPDYANSEIFAQGQMEKSTDCYGITTVKIGGRIVDSIVTMPSSGSWMNINLSDLCPDQDFTIYRKNFWALGNAYTIK
jgi:hypothetical protein